MVFASNLSLNTIFKHFDMDIKFTFKSTIIMSCECHSFERKKSRNFCDSFNTVFSFDFILVLSLHAYLNTFSSIRYIHSIAVTKSFSNYFDVQRYVCIPDWNVWCLFSCLYLIQFFSFFRNCMVILLVVFKYAWLTLN